MYASPSELSKTVASRKPVQKATLNHTPQQTPESSAGSKAVGFLLTDLHFKPIYTNEAAVSILTFADSPRLTASPVTLVQRVRGILNAERFVAGMNAVDFFSGRRLYVCRPSLMQARESRGRPPIVALLLERQVREHMPLSEISRRYHLSRRECETVQYLIEGLTTKEAAQRMSVSPNTVKQFIRLIMSKMGVTTRSGIVGKLLAS
jgi:DNA-binding CsgD family transcriptional regulator